MQVLFFSSISIALGAQRLSFDDDWSFEYGDNCLTETAFPLDLTNTQCFGLHQVKGANTVEMCANSCCGDSQCEVWQFMAGDKSCWVGAMGDCKATSSGITSRGRRMDVALTCKEEDFAVDLNDLYCAGYSMHSFIESATTVESCRQACCSDASCQLYKFCPPSDTRCSPKGCYIGLMGGCNTDRPGWISAMRDVPSTPSITACSFAGCASSTDDSSWSKVQLPHDMVLSPNFTQGPDTYQNSLGGHGFLSHERVGWYRKHFLIDREYEGASIWIDFDGIFRNAQLYLNGEFIGFHASGYYPVRVLLTPRDKSLLRYGPAANVLSVRVDSSLDEGWWYEGGGIYRHAWINYVRPLHIAPWGVYVAGNVTGSIVSDGAGGEVASTADVTAWTNVTNDGDEGSAFTVVSTILNSKGTVLAQGTSTLTHVDAGASVAVLQKLSLPGPVSLWSVPSPTLLTLRTQVVVQGQGLGGVVDSSETLFGVRKVSYDATNGLVINDVPVKVKGMCNHQDFAGCGTALPDRINEFKVLKQKEMGANAWRMSHNPPNSELLDLCDKYGMLVWDENRGFGNNSQFLSDFADMVQRDRNHPSIVYWSLCNEFGCLPGGNMNYYEVANMFVEVVRKHDFLNTRAVTAGMNNGWESPTSITQSLDVVGINYSVGEYDKYHAAHPTTPLIGSETASLVSDRGRYSNDVASGHLWGYDIEHPSVGWGSNAQDAWRPIAERAFMQGGFVWTGFDYKGEPTPYSWPNINSHFGVIDIAGFPKDDFHWYRVWWNDLAVPRMHLFPHWNWQAGAAVRVWVYANVEEVELLINNVSAGRQAMSQYSHLEWNVTFEAGSLEAVGYIKGAAVIRQVRNTTGTASAIVMEKRLVGDNEFTADGHDVVMIEVSVVDSFGAVVPTAGNNVTFSIVSGPGRVYGVGNGDPSDHDPDKASYRKAFNGYCMVIIQSTITTGDIVIAASSPGLSSSTIVLSSRSGKTNIHNQQGGDVMQQ